jgi:hypothetical protein
MATKNFMLNQNPFRALRGPLRKRNGKGILLGHTKPTMAPLRILKQELI